MTEEEVAEEEVEDEEEGEEEEEQESLGVSATPDNDPLWARIEKNTE